MTLWRAGREGEESGGAAGSPVGVVCVFSVGALLMAAERTAIPLYLNTKKSPPPAASPQLQGFASSFAHFQAKIGSAAAFWCTFVTPPVNKRCQFRMVSNPPPARLTSALKRSLIVLENFTPLSSPNFWCFGANSVFSLTFQISLERAQTLMQITGQKC